MSTQQVGSTETGFLAAPAVNGVELSGPRRISWAAIFAGGIIGIIVQIALSLLGTGIGASVIHPTSSNSADAGQLGIGSAVWLCVSTLISLFAGGWVAGRLAAVPRGVDAILHGLVVWALSTFLTIWLLTTALGALFGGVGSILGGAFNAGGQGIAAVSPALSRAAGQQLQRNGITADSAVSQVQQTLQETGNAKLQPDALAQQGRHLANQGQSAAASAALNPSDAKSTQNDLLAKISHDAGGTIDAADRTSLINVIQARTHTTRAQATRTADQYIAQARTLAQQTRQTVARAQQGVREAGAATATGVARASLTAFVLLVLGAVVAGLGGFTGAPRGLIVKDVIPPSNRGIEYRSAAVR